MQSLYTNIHSFKTQHYTHLKLSISNIDQVLYTHCQFSKMKVYSLQKCGYAVINYFTCIGTFKHKSREPSNKTASVCLFKESSGNHGSNYFLKQQSPTVKKVQDSWHNFELHLLWLFHTEFTGLQQKQHCKHPSIFCMS